ncbi:MAG: hypothetical protein IPG26_07800 [Coprothermobacter sp.]|nr:hypothetical protein [Coprothermobacter sp.]
MKKDMYYQRLEYSPYKRRVHNQPHSQNPEMWYLGPSKDTKRHVDAVRFSDNIYNKTYKYNESQLFAEDLKNLNNNGMGFIFTRMPMLVS